MFVGLVLGGVCPCGVLGGVRPCGVLEGVCPCGVWGGKAGVYAPDAGWGYMNVVVYDTLKTLEP